MFLKHRLKGTVPDECLEEEEEDDDEKKKKIMMKKKKKKKKGPPSLQLLGKSLAQNDIFLKRMKNPRRLLGKSAIGGTKTSAMLHGNHFF